MGKKEKTEVGDEDGEGIKQNPEQICRWVKRIPNKYAHWHICLGFFFNSFPN